MSDLVCRVPLTGGNVRNHHFYLRSCRNIIPAGGMGGKNALDLGTPFTVRFEPGETVETDVDGSKMILSSRKPVRDFFERSGAVDGDNILIERTGERSLRITLEARSNK